MMSKITSIASSYNFNDVKFRKLIALLYTKYEMLETSNLVI